MTFESSIPAALLSNERLLQHLLRHRVDGIPPPWDGEPFAVDDPYEYYALREFQVRDGFQDNEIFRSRWRYFCQEKQKGFTDGWLALAALEALCKEYLEFSHGGLHIKLERYAEWQNLMAGINFHPIIACAMQMDELGGKWKPNGLERHDAEKTEESYRVWGNSLCYPYDSAVEDYIRQRGLNDAHLHINVCAYAEASWIHAVCHPHESYEYLIERGHSDSFRQQFLEVFGDQPTATLEKHLQLAANIRCILRAHSAELPLCRSNEYSGRALCLALHERVTNLQIDALAEISLPAPPDDADWEQSPFPTIIHRERVWMARLIRSLQRTDTPDAVRWLAKLLHVYVLLMNEYCNLLTMTESQKGFNQFDHTQSVHHHLSWHDSYYFETFKHFHGQGADSIVHHLDARIAPKTSVEENENTIHPILRDYLRYLDWVAAKNGGTRQAELSAGEYSQPLDSTIEAIHQRLPQMKQRHLKLNLTAHFIKRRDAAWEERNSHRHHSYREELDEQVNALHGLLHKLPEAGDFLRGIDAANDEQNVPPSVLAPCFRACRSRLNIDNITFHCGEDFPHLLTGLRVLHDAAIFLEMKRGDRIGHATALGIHPEYWAQHSPATLCIRKEDRILDLLLACQALKQEPGDFSPLLHHMLDELMELAHSIFGGYVPTFTPFDLAAAMKLRHLDPKYLIALLGTEEQLIPLRIEEFKKHPNSYAPIFKDGYDAACDEYKHMRKTLQETQSPGIRLLMAWFTSREVWQRGQQYTCVEIERDQLPAYLRIQQHLMREFCNRGIIIETLLTSNLRIACYRHATEHHAMRWLHCGSAAVEGDPKLQLAFGSDDPGIFSCDAKAEFYLLYTSLRAHGVSEQEALTKLHEVNRRGRVYSFANTNNPRAL